MKYLKDIAIIFSGFLLLGSMPYEPEYRIELPCVPFIYECDEPETVSIPPRRNVPEAYRRLFNTTAEIYGIPPGVLESIAFVESGFDPAGLSPPRNDGRRDLGMFQFNNAYLVWYADRYNSGYPFDPMVPEEAAPIAAEHIRYLYERYNHWPTVCLAYNAGMTAVDNDVIPDGSFRYLVKVYEEENNGITR
jgi:soluble lytic murein transglycosylase-like protein